MHIDHSHLVLEHGRAGGGEEVYLCGSTDALSEIIPRPLSAGDYLHWTTEVELSVGTYVEFEWLKRRTGTVVERFFCWYGVKVGKLEGWKIGKWKGGKV